VGDGGLLINALMWARSVVEVHELNHDAPQMSYIDPR